MKKKLVYLLVLLMVVAQSVGIASAKASSSKLSPEMRNAVKKYRAGNYTGCLQTCQSIVGKHPSNATAYYYMAISYVQAGNKKAAISNYKKVLSLSPNQKLSDYAATGQRCLETPDKCVLKVVHEKQAELAEIDKFIASPLGDGLSKSVRSDFQQKRLDMIRNEINSGNNVNGSSFNRLNYSIPNDSKINNDDKLLAQTKPNDEQVKDALKVLNDAGMDTTRLISNPMMQAGSSNYQNEELAQLSALMGGSQSSKNNSSDAMMNMLPYMMMQNKDGSTNYSPQLMQSVIMGSMMNSFDYNVDNKK